MVRSRLPHKSEQSRLFLDIAIPLVVEVAGWWFIARLRTGEAHKVAHTFLNAIRRGDASAILQICHPEEVEALSLREEEILPTLRALRMWFFGSGTHTSIARISQGKRDWLVVLLREEANSKQTQYDFIIYNTPYGYKILWTNTVLGFAVRAVREELRPKYPSLASAPLTRGTLLRQMVEERVIQWGVRRVWRMTGEIDTLPSPPY